MRQDSKARKSVVNFAGKPVIAWLIDTEEEIAFYIMLLKERSIYLV